MDKLIMKPIPINDIKPKGWLKKQLKIQAKGLSGNLHKFWPSIKNSQWIGGDDEGWERLPYYLDGIIPLAWLIDDKELKSVSKECIDKIIAGQKENGWICPGTEEDRDTYDVWALFLVLKTLVVWHDATGDERIQDVIEKALKSCDYHIDHNTLFGWAQTRWYEALVSIIWLYERTGEKWLINLTSKLHAQGFDWEGLFDIWPYEEPEEYGRWSQMNHVVNQVMMLKGQALFDTLIKGSADGKAVQKMLEKLDKYHGVVTGMINGDECLSGKSPVQGHELCAVVEMMYSLEWLSVLTMDPAWGDRLEMITYNSLPATFLPDMVGHQYDQQINQVECSVQEKPIFLTNGPESNLFGVEPNYGCCTANMHQGWPKFAANIFLRNDDTIAITVYAPAECETIVNGTCVKINIDTEYPFKENINITVSAERDVEFTLALRIPKWADDAKAKIDGDEVSIHASQYYMIKRVFGQERTINLKLPMQPELTGTYDNTYAVKRGPLIFSLPIEQEMRLQNKDEGQMEPWLNNYELFPKSPWNYALCLNEATVKDLLFTNNEIKDTAFDYREAPVETYVDAVPILWPLEKGSALKSPGKIVVTGKKTRIKLVPYGSTNLRMTQMPLVEKV